MVIKSLKQFLLSTAMFMAVVTFHLSQVSTPKVVKVHEIKMQDEVLPHTTLEVAKTESTKKVNDKI